MKRSTISFLIACHLIGACSILNAQNSEAETQALKLEVKTLKTQLKEEKQERVKAQLNLLYFLSKNLPSQSDDSRAFESFKTLALKLSGDLPRDVTVWKALVHTNSLEGMTLKQASAILGSPTSHIKGAKLSKRPGIVVEYSWYYNPAVEGEFRRQVAPCLIARVENGKLNEWAVIKR